MPRVISKIKIVAICQVRNEDVFIERVLANILPFCDTILVADHQSKDNTASIVKRLAESEPKIQYTLISHPSVAHQMIRPYCNTATWIFPVDGDEIYDPHGLTGLRLRLEAGEFDQYRQLYGHSLHCVNVDFSAKTANGYMTPPCRTVTKLYNFEAIKDWEGPCNERCHGGHIVFNPGWTETSNGMILEQFSWDNSPFRLLHTCFIRRSSLQDNRLSPIPNVAETYGVSKMRKLRNWIAQRRGRSLSSTYKFEKYQRGVLAQYDISKFILS